MLRILPLFIVNLSAFLLHLFKCFPVDDRIVHILEDRPVFFFVLPTLFVLLGFRVGLEIDDIAAVLFLSKDLRNGRASPTILVFG